MGYDYKRLIELIRYGTEDELRNALVSFIERNRGSEEGMRTIRRIFLGLRLEPRLKIKKVFLMAVAETALWDPEILDTVFLIARDDPEPELRSLAEQVALRVLKNSDEKNKKEVFMFILRAIDRRLVYLSPIDLVKIVGESFVRKLLEEEAIPRNLRELIEFGLSEVEKS